MGLGLVEVEEGEAVAAGERKPWPATSLRESQIAAVIAVAVLATATAALAGTVRIHPQAW